MPVTRTLNFTLELAIQFQLESAESTDKGSKIVFIVLPNLGFARETEDVKTQTLERLAIEEAKRFAASLCDGLTAADFEGHYAYPGPAIVLTTHKQLDTDAFFKRWKEEPKVESFW